VNIIFTKVMFTDLASVILVVISLNIFLFWPLTNALGYVSMGEARAGERREVLWCADTCGFGDGVISAIRFGS